MLTHSARSRLPIMLLAMGGVVSCAEHDSNTVSPFLSPNAPQGDFVSMSSCGASFRAITDETDSLMVAYGIGTTSDTVDACEMWTGSDYQYQVVGAGSSENLPGLTDTVQTVTYQSGYMRGYTQGGADASEPGSVSSSFDLVRADDATRQASYDDPYYGVSSHDPNACLQPPCPLTSINVPTQGAATGAAAPSTVRHDVGADTLFSRYGITRRGVRALVNQSEEIGLSARGYRQFRAVTPTMTIIRSVDPITQLLMEEDISLPDEHMHVTHTWSKVLGGYVKARSVYVSTQVIDGRTVTSFGSLQLLNVRITDPHFAPLSSANRVN